MYPKSRNIKSIVAEALAMLREKVEIVPRVGIICGSGLGLIADRAQITCVIPYQQIPGFPRSTVAGHAGQLLLGTIQRVPVAILQGRVHLFEGYSSEEVVFPVRLLAALGIDTLIVTNAAGGLKLNYSVGDIMVIDDHLNLPGFAGLSPLRGPGALEFGERFVPLNHAYDRELKIRALQIAGERGVAIRRGVYAMVVGPNYETPAEVRLLQKLGADAVGMSTVPEVIAASQLGLRVLAFSVITNVAVASSDVDEEPNHEEVQVAGANAGPVLADIIAELIKSLD